MLDLDGLSAEQRRAVRAPAGGPLLIAAGPGSGKTAVLTHRVAWLIAEARARPVGGAADRLHQSGRR